MMSALETFIAESKSSARNRDVHHTITAQSIGFGEIDERHPVITGDTTPCPEPQCAIGMPVESGGQLFFAGNGAGEQ